MESFPDDALLQVLRHLPYRDLGSASCVCRQWSRVARDDRLWESICLQLWPSSRSVVTSRVKNGISTMHTSTVMEGSLVARNERISDVTWEATSSDKLDSNSLLSCQHIRPAKDETSDALACESISLEERACCRATLHEESSTMPRVPAETKVPALVVQGTFRAFAYRRLRLASPTAEAKGIPRDDVRFLLDLSFCGESVFSFALRYEDLSVSEMADSEDFDFTIRHFPPDVVLPFSPASQTRTQLRDRPSVYAEGLQLRFDLFRPSTGEMLQLIAGAPWYQADDLSTLVFCQQLPTLPFGTGLLAEVNIEYRVMEHFSCVLPRHQHSSTALEDSTSEATEQEWPANEFPVNDEGEKLLRWEFRFCRMTVKKSASFRMASCSELMSYLGHLSWS